MVFEASSFKLSILLKKGPHAEHKTSLTHLWVEATLVLRVQLLSGGGMVNSMDFYCT